MKLPKCWRCGRVEKFPESSQAEFNHWNEIGSLPKLAKSASGRSLRSRLQSEPEEHEALTERSPIMGRTKKKVTKKNQVSAKKKRSTAKQMAKRLAAMSPAERQKHELRLCYNRWKDDLGRRGKWAQRAKFRKELVAMQKEALTGLGVTVSEPAEKEAFHKPSAPSNEQIKRVAKKLKAELESREMKEALAAPVPATEKVPVSPSRRLAEIAIELERLDVVRETLAEEAAKLSEQLVAALRRSFSEIKGGVQ